MKVVIKKGMKPPTKPVPVQPIAQEEAVDEVVGAEGEEEEVQAEAVEIYQPTATIDKEYPDGTSTHEQVPVGEPGPKPQPHANVGVSMGMTIKTAEYCNIKFNVSLFCPCPVDVDSINGTYEEVKAWVDSKVGEINEEIQAQLG